MADRYNGWQGAIGKKTIDTNTSWPMTYSDVWSLKARTIDNKLRFLKKELVKDLYNPYNPFPPEVYKSTMTTMANPPTSDRLVINGPPGSSDARLREFDPSNPTDTKNYVNYYIDNVQLLRNDSPAHLIQGPDPFNISILANTGDGLSFCQNGDETVDTLYFSKATGQECKWRTDQEAFACCTTPLPLTDDFRNKCAPAFVPGQYDSLCYPLMMGICEANWDDKICQQYLSSFENNPDVVKIVQDTIKNYINNQGKRTGCGGNDYTTPSLNSCIIKSGVDRGKYRDDSKDPFLNGTLISLCNSTSKVGACDLMLDQYCAQFTRGDLSKDPVLHSLCGCHLRTSNPVEDSGLTLSQKPADKEQYVYPGMSKTCDPLCASADVIPTNEEPACKQTVCIMDSVGINMINSNCNGNVEISQVCGADYSNQNGTGSCYIDSAYINLINSTCGGARIIQHCGNCFVYDKGSGTTAQRVDCQNLNQQISEPTPPSSPSSSSKSERQSFGEIIKSHPYAFSTLCIIILLIVIFLILFLVSKPKV